MTPPWPMRKERPLPDGARPGGDLSDEGLVAAAGRSDPVAMGAFFDRHHQAVYRFLSRLDGDSPDIDDLVHATFVQAFRSASRFRATSSVRTWLFGIAVNVSRHHVRGETRRRAFLRSLHTQPRTESARPDLMMERRQTLERLSQALAGLSHERRAAFVLCDVEELSGAEAALALGAPPGTVSRWLYEARTGLRAALEEAVR